MTSPTKLCMIIRNIFVVLVIYDYFSVVVCQCQLHQISVPSCPRSTHEWSLRAREICTMKDRYHCLITENHNEDKRDLIECCMPYKNISRGHMPRYNTFKKTIQEIACDHGYYMTTTFASNRYRLNGVEHCNDKKSACVMEGMKIYDNGSTTEDRKCYCDYKNNFKPGLSLDPNVVYFYEKDNDCSISECDLEFQEMNMMYQCVNVCKDGEYRPERSMDCIPKSSTTIPPVVVSTNGSTAGVVIKTTLQTTTKSTPENSFEQTETNDTAIKIILPLLAVVVIGAIICCIVKTCKDRNRNTYNIHNAHNVIIGSRNVLQENDSASNPEEVPLIEVAVPIIELKGHTFNVDEGKSVAIECNIKYQKKYHPPFWERINENDETNKLTIREDKKDKYLGLKSDPPYLRILNAEMSDRGYYRCCIEYSTSNGEETVRSKKAHLIVEEVSPSKPEEVPLIEVVAPGQPRNIKAKVLSPKRIEVSWLPTTDSANISYNVYFNDSSVMEQPNNNYVLEDLIPDTVYHIQVSATSNGREGEKSPTIDVKTPPFVPIIELKGYTFNVDEGKSVAIECNNFIIYEKQYRAPFWERIHENDETNKWTIIEDKKDKYLGLESDPPYLRILNAEMSDRGYYRCCIEYSTSNGEETVRSKKAHLIVEEVSHSNTEEVPVMEVVAPGQPRNIKAKVLSPKRIEVSWLPTTDSANISYNVYFNDSSVMEQPNNNYVLEDLIPDTVYHIQVSATSNGREGEKSPTIDVKTPPFVPVIELKQHTFTVYKGESVTIECKNISYEENYRPHFWERIHENDETNKLTIREDKENKYSGFQRDPLCLTILNAEMSDGGDYCCCIEYSTSNGKETVRSKKAHLIVEKAVKPQVNINVKNMRADIINMGGDGKNITVKNTSEDLKEKANNSVGSSSSSSSENSSSSSSSSENASSSGNETSSNIDKTEQGTQNSDCGQETGDVDINIEKKSKLKPVSVTEQGSDENNIKGNSINEDTEEKMNTLKGSNPLSVNKMSNNCDEMEKGTHNSDCGNETGDVGVNKVEKSNMKPVSVTGKKNISLSDIERIAGEHGFSVEDVCGDGNCMFHAIALQLKSKIGEEKSKKLRCNIVEFLKNNDTTPAGEKYSSFLSSVHENERESEWSKYLASMSKPGTYGDEIVLRAVSHCFNVRIDVLSTASPERFITYNSPDNSEDSTVYLGFIDKLSHYVRLQPKSSENQRPYTSMNESSV